jgi:hypothetical protein
MDMGRSWGLIGPKVGGHTLELHIELDGCRLQMLQLVDSNLKFECLFPSCPEPVPARVLYADRAGKVYVVVEIFLNFGV